MSPSQSSTQRKNVDTHKGRKDIKGMCFCEESRPPPPVLLRRFVSHPLITASLSCCYKSVQPPRHLPKTHQTSHSLSTMRSTLFYPFIASLLGGYAVVVASPTGGAAAEADILARAGYVVHCPAIVLNSATLRGPCYTDAYCLGAEYQVRPRDRQLCNLCRCQRD